MRGSMEEEGLERRMEARSWRASQAIVTVWAAVGGSFVGASGNLIDVALRETSKDCCLSNSAVVVAHGHCKVNFLSTGPQILLT